jgi:hypothetical protein
MSFLLAGIENNELVQKKVPIIQRVLIIGDFGSFAYPIFRWIIWNSDTTKKYLWIDNHGNNDFISQQRHPNINVVYDDELDMKNILIEPYDGSFINGLELFSKLNLSRSKPMVIRSSTKIVNEYTLNTLQSMFDIIIIPYPKNDETGRRDILRLIGDYDEFEKQKRRDDIVLIYKNEIHFSKVIFPREFPMNR